MTRLYGRCLRGDRLPEAQPYHRKTSYSILSAMDYQGVMAAVYGEWATDRSILLEFLEKDLCPKLRPYHKVIMDNVPFHKHQSVKETIESTGAELIYLPPYSPEYSPIENMWSKIKSVLRAHRAKTEAAFKLAMSKAFYSITPKDCLGWFKHCGYLDQLKCEPL